MTVDVHIDGRVSAVWIRAFSAAAPIIVRVIGPELAFEVAARVARRLLRVRVGGGRWRWWHFG